MKWDPDPRWPECFVSLASAIACGEDVRYMLADLFEEEVMVECTKHMRVGERCGILSPSYARGTIVGYILNDGYKLSPNIQYLEGRMLKEMCDFLKRREYSGGTN